ncbi:unnamed protein product [Durusdinium trenchii]|uniref:Uncharacterized protein n=1 Tax=Durusdinium trenchii TaxID=1381693 RepID=A0ABP0T2N6_9DINO
MEQRESDLAIVCRLAHEHLSEGAKGNDVLRRLPRDFRSGVDEIVKDIHTSIEVPPLFANSGGTLSFIFRKLVGYQTQQNHHQPPGRLQRFTSFSAREANTCDNFHAKRVVCELLKTWACCSPGAANDDSINPEEIDPYLSFLRHLMYYHDRWSAKLWGSDAFMEIMIQTIRKLESLKRDTADARQKYLRVLEHIYEASNELLDHALRVTMLVVSDQHAEFEQLVTKEGPMTLKLLSQRASDIRNNSQFWSSDLGQVLHSALVRADPQRFKPTGTGDIENATAARVWNLWTDELRTVKRYEYSSVEEARLVFEQCRCCTVLVGPEGKMQEKSLAAATSQMLSKVLQEDSTLRELNRRVEQSLGLQRAALGLPFHEKVTAIEDFFEQTDSANGSADVSEAPNYWHDAVSKVRDAWMAGQTDASGVAELFRGGKKVKWIEGVFEKESKCSDFPTIILDLSKTFADLLCCHKEVMSAVRGMIGEGGSKEALAAIYALRQRNTITGQLDGCMQRFMASANLLHGFYEHMFFESLEGNKKIKGQTESIRSCGKIRDDILTQWHKLGLQVTDDNLAEEAKRIDMTEKAAFCQLMGMPSPTLALTGGSAAKAQLQLPDAEKVQMSQSPRSDAGSPVELAPAPLVEELKSKDKANESSESGDDLAEVFR